MESARIAALQSYFMAESATGEPFNTLVRMAANLTQAPIAMISLIGRDHQSVKAAFGAEIQQIPRSLAFCNHTIAEPSGAMVIPDTWADPRFQHFPQVVSPPHIRFYAGVCLTDTDGYVLGTLCVMDHKPSYIEDNTLAVLHTMAREVMNAFALQRGEQGAGWNQATPGGDWLDQPVSRRISPAPSLPLAPQAWLGVRTEHTPVRGSNQEGRLLTSVAANSPAERANLLVGDVILSIDGRITKRRNDITAAVANRVPGGNLRLQVWRSGSLFECELCPEPVPEARLLQRSAW